LSSCHFHPVFKQSIVSPLLKKSTLDNEQLSDYRPISKLSLISKLIERVVNLGLLISSFFTIFWIFTNLLTVGTMLPKRLSFTRPRPPHHCYWFMKAFLALSRSIDLSTAFDTIDHEILLTRLSSWFGIHGSVLYWCKSYLSSRTFCVKCNDCFSFLHTSLYGVPQGSVLGPLVFIIVYNSSQYSHFILVIISSPLCWWNTTSSLILSLRLLGKQHSPP